MKNDFILMENIAVTYYYGRFSVVDENVTPMSESRDFPSPNISLFSKLYLVTEGKYEITLNGKVCLVKGGDMLLIPSGVEFKFNDSFKKFKQYWAHFNISYLNNKNTDFLMSFNTEYIYHIRSKTELKELSRVFDRLIYSASQSSILLLFPAHLKNTRAYRQANTA